MIITHFKPEKCLIEKQVGIKRKCHVQRKTLGQKALSPS